MATKPADLLERIPGVNELLDKPPLRTLVERWNRSVVVSGVWSFLGELRSDLQRRTAEANFPSLRELAERAARHVVQMQQSSVRPAINATGRFFDAAWVGAPLADEALERMAALGHGFVRQLAPHSVTTGPRAGDAAAAVCRLTGAEAATLVHSYSAAIWLTLAAVAAGKNIVIARSELGDDGLGCSVDELAASAGAKVMEAGATNRATAIDYETCITGETAAIVKYVPDCYRVVGDTRAVELDALVSLSRDREVILIHAIGAAPLVDDLPISCDGLCSAAASIAAGAQAVIVRGDGLVGGPPCGILAGSREIVRLVESHPQSAAWRLDALRAAALGATLELYGDGLRSIPLFQLLSTSVENLQHRAERLAPQIAAAEIVAAAEPLATQNCLGIAACAEQRMPSYGIALTASNGDLCALEERLQTSLIPILPNRQQDRLVLDLRTVLPRQDPQLVESIVGHGPADSAAHSATSADDARTEAGRPA